ncbi:amidohydrolase [Kribbella orskensis]|uniref:Amidohydrolase n=1 Tax=Kribbella orskensis TaxID=2512216 RepID=A0ABY2BVI4_9ACTN|nr:MULTISPECIES: amidohydrolase [Kribbella]TCN44056.1 amidohydrolase [Kribbella sp. VKM Ac-2500]TCO32166.1 amidohydrolase [Kribbella orskensis]
MTTSHHPAHADVKWRVAQVREEVVAVRRDLHAHPELGWHEVRTTEVLRQRLTAAGLSPQVLPTGTGLICDIGSGDTCVALRADIDALPVPDAVDAPWRSGIEGVAHACGHDVHTAALLGAGLVLAGMAADGLLDRRVRLIFQPAEEVMPGGALGVIAAGGLEGVHRIYGLHCDPRLEVGQIGLRVGALTAAADRILVRLNGPGGHTSRPHLTADLVYALATLVTELPAALSRRVDPRAGMSLVWGRITSGSAANAIPARGEVEGTLRCLDVSAWRLAAELIPTLAAQLAAPYEVEVDTEVTHGVPPVMNDAAAIEVFKTAVERTMGSGAVAATDQSLGGEDFAWYLEHVPGAMARLGVRPAGVETAADLHTPGFNPSEDAIALGITLLATSALLD